MDVVGGVPPGDDILAPSFAAGVPPGFVLPGIGGGPVGPPVDVDSFTYGRHFNFEQQASVFEFSVDAFATGIPFSGSGVDVQAMASPPGRGAIYKTAP